MKNYLTLTLLLMMSQISFAETFLWRGGDSSCENDRYIYHVGDTTKTSINEDTTRVILQEIHISSGTANPNTSSLRLKKISSDEIKALSPGKTYPELLKGTPSVYATTESGSYGDAKINIRGFKQENISVLLNGIPISGLTSGSMFWNNWLGLTDATSSIQIQKGIGASMLSDNSVGGTINIVTHTPSINPSAELAYSYLNYGTSKISLNYNSGKLPKGWGVVLSASYTWGKGYVECTDVNSWSYLLSISKKINSKHSLLLTTLGSPERHQQRSIRLTNEEVEKYGVNYSKNWGYYQGEAKTISANNYFKPYLTLNHFYNDNVGKDKQIKLSLNNALYFAIGTGGGVWTEGKDRNNRIIDHQKDGHIDWDAVVEGNKENNGEYGGFAQESASKNIMSNYMAGHYQFGLNSALQLDINKRLKVDAGAHYQMYRTWQKEQITDLLGGDYWFEDYAKNSLAGVAGRNPYKKVGDYVRLDNGRNTNFITIFGAITYSPGESLTKGDNFNPKWILKLGGTLSASSHQRWDRYNYTTDINSEVAYGIGGSVKGGVLYRINTNNSLYINGGAYSRAPYSGVYFASGNNVLSENVKNESNYLGELGYRFIHNRGGVELTFYAAYWKDKTMMSDPYKPLEDADDYRFMIEGLDAFHYGIELDAYYNFTDWFTVSVFGSIGDWRWKNNVSANIYDPYSGAILDVVNVYSDGLHVGDAPQTQVGANLEFEILELFNTSLFNSALTFRADWQYNTRYWADFDPTDRTDPNDHSQSYRIPSYHLVNLGFNWEQRFNNKTVVNLFVNVNNLLDEIYIDRGRDGSNHDLDTFTGYWGAPRSFNFGVRIGF